MDLPPGVSWTQDEESLEVSVSVAHDVIRESLRVTTSSDSLSVSVRSAQTWRPLLSGTLRHAVEGASCCWALEKTKRGRAVNIQLEKQEEQEWDVLLRADTAGSILEELGRDQVIVDAGAESSVCGRCGAMVKTSRMEAHATMWCDALSSDDARDAGAAAAKPRAASHLLCYGDSLTDGFLDTSLATGEFEPWAPVLSDALGVGAVHVGMSGWTSEEMLLNTDDRVSRKADVCGKRAPGLSVLLRAEPRPTHALLMAGTNDLGRTTSDAIVANLRRLHDICHAAGCATIAISIPQTCWSNPQLDDPALMDLNDKRVRINRSLADYAASKPGQCQYVAMDEELPYESDSANWAPDGLHMSRAGYRRFGAILAPKIRDFVAPPAADGEPPAKSAASHLYWSRSTTNPAGATPAQKLAEAVAEGETLV